MGALAPAASIVSGLAALTGGGGATLPMAAILGQFASTQRLFETRAEEANRAGDMRAKQSLALKQLKQKQTLDLQNAQEKGALEGRRIVADTAAAESKRRAALKRAIARQKVGFASRGISPASGSAEAIMLGLFEESDDEREERGRLDTLRQSAINQNLSQKRSLNVLQRTQLKERQRFEQELLG